MTILATKVCVTCTKPCYPTERLMVSDLWVHKAGCLKCSECSGTLSLSSVYVAPSPATPHERLLWCAKHVPKMVHTSVVDSVALKTAMSGSARREPVSVTWRESKLMVDAPNPTTTPAAVYAKSKSKGKTLRFKGLTIRSKAISASLNAPKLEVVGRQRAQQIFVGHVGAGLDSWDIAHAMAVQSHVSSPIKGETGLQPQYTGMSEDRRSVSPLMPDVTGSSVTSAKTNEEDVRIQPDLVKNLIKVFQLDTVDAVEVTPVPELTHDSDVSTPPSSSGSEPGSDSSDDEYAPSLAATLRKCTGWGGSIKPSASALSTLSALSQCGTYRGAGAHMGVFDTCTVKTLGTIGSKRGTLTLARIKGTLRRPALSELFNDPSEDCSVGRVESDDDNDEVNDGGNEMLSLPMLTAGTPANTPMKGLYNKMEIEDGMASQPGTVRMRSKVGGMQGSLRCSTLRAPSTLGKSTVRSTRLLEALLPLAAHLVPLPADDQDEWDDNVKVADSPHISRILGCHPSATIAHSRKTTSAEFEPEQISNMLDEEDEAAHLELIKHLEMGGLELIMMFEKEAEEVAVLI